VRPHGARKIDVTLYSITGVAPEIERAIQRLLRAGTGIHKTAQTVGVGTATVQRIRAEIGPFDASAAA
jgi:transposase-like protein